jgi:2-oxoacid:acceptor oxidoreductase delta subunit (pyruvate/2-ketoisovalerate family)
MVKECEKVVIPALKEKKRSRKGRKAGFSSNEHGVTEEEALHEAQRCLGRSSCESCDLCSLLCPDLCITREEGSGSVLIDLDYCKGCGICAAVCPKGAIEMAPEE